MSLRTRFDSLCGQVSLPNARPTLGSVRAELVEAPLANFANSQVTKRRTGFADFAKDAESQVFVRESLSFCSAKWQRKQLTKMILAYVVARYYAE